MPTHLPPVGALLEPLYSLFGWVMRTLYSFIPNYGWSIIIFTAVLILVMIPLQLKQHKTGLKQMQLTDEINELKRYYGDDRNGFAMAQQELFKKHKVSLMGGCLPMLLSFVLILPIWRIISQPMHYILGIATENLSAIAQKLFDLGLVAENVVKNVASSDIAVLNALSQSGPAMNEAVGAGLLRADQLLNLNFLGINLGLVPSFNPAQVFGAEMRVYLPLFIIPLLAVATSFLGTMVANRTNAQMLVAKRARELAKLNPARDVVDDQSARMSKQMALMMPIITLITVFTLPAAMGLYWIVGNVVRMFQSYLLYILYSKPILKQLWKEEPVQKLERSKA